jgi:hypothetical protein
MIAAKTRPWIWLMPGIVALCLMPLVVAIDGGRSGDPTGWPISEPINGPWPSLFSNGVADVNPDIAMLQLRANVTLARLIEAGHAAE